MQLTEEKLRRSDGFNLMDSILWMLLPTFGITGARTANVSISYMCENGPISIDVISVVTW